MPVPHSGLSTYLPTANDQHDRIATTLDVAGIRTLIDHTADSRRVAALHDADRTVPLPNLAFRSRQP
jgi:hypothetical protein